MTTLDDRPDHAVLPGAPPDPEALIKEARRLRRRRYLLTGVALLAVLGAIAAGLAMSQGGGGRSPGGGHQTATTAPRAAPPTSAQKPPGVALPSSALFNQISATSNGLLLNGVTNAAGENPEGPCVAAPIDPQTLAVGKLDVGSCGDPLLFGRTAEAVNTPVPQSNNGTVSIDVADPATGQVTDGPVVMTYGSYSDTRPVIAYGSQWLWIYDVETTNGPELLQASLQSGDVVDTIRMPALYRPLLAADDGGVWVANSLGGSPAPALFYVTAGSSSPSLVISDTNVPICWLTADGTSAWVGAGLENGCVKQTVERFVDHGQAPLFITAGTYMVFTVVGNQANGLWSIAASPNEQELVSIDPTTGTESLAATLPYVQEPLVSQDEGLVQGQAVSFDGVLYLLEPPFRLNGYLGYTSVVRVPLQGG